MVFKQGCRPALELVTPSARSACDCWHSTPFSAFPFSHSPILLISLFPTTTTTTSHTPGAGLGREWGGHFLQRPHPPPPHLCLAGAPLKGTHPPPHFTNIYGPPRNFLSSLIYPNTRPTLPGMDSCIAAPAEAKDGTNCRTIEGKDCGSTLILLNLYGKETSFSPCKQLFLPLDH